MQIDIFTLVQAIREGGHTERVHTVPHLLDASVAKHSWNMAAMLALLYPEASKNLILAAIFHDVSERWIGDTPAPAKYSIEPDLGHMLHRAESKVERALGIMQMTLTPEEKTWLKAIDILEFVMYCSDELAMGNRHIEVSLRNARAILSGDWVPRALREFAESYEWRRTSDLIEGDTMEALTDEQHTKR